MLGDEDPQHRRRPAVEDLAPPPKPGDLRIMGSTHALKIASGFCERSIGIDRDSAGHGAMQP